MDRIYELMSGQAQFWEDSWEGKPSTARKGIWGNSNSIFRPRHPAHDQTSALPPVPAGAASLRGVLGRIDWAADPERLRKGDLGGLAADVRRALELAASAVAEIAVLAGLLGVSAGAVAVALVARAEAGGNRNAARLARSVFGSAGAETLDAAARAVGL